jgi:tRNA threonylcarbamoyl adenosine modification protein YeaZ
MYILGIESSTKKLSIAVNKKQCLISRVTGKGNKDFMTQIIPLIDRCLKKADLDITAIDLFSVDTGPGDFTGTRIGISVAKAFSISCSRPVFGIPGLDIFVSGMLVNNINRIRSFLREGFNPLLIPVLDVKNSEIFTGVYTVKRIETQEAICRFSKDGSDYFIEEAIPAKLIESNGIIGFFSESFQVSKIKGIPAVDNVRIFFGGTAFNSYKDLFVELKKTKMVFFLDKKDLYPSASALNLCAYYRILSEADNKIEKKEYMGKSNGGSQMTKDSSVSPLYIRDFIPFGKNNVK